MATLEETKACVEHALDQLQRLFVPGMKLTFIARLPGNDEADFIITSDDMDEVKKACARQHVKLKRKH